MISMVKGSCYVPFGKEKRVVVAGWAHGGTIASRSLDNIAPINGFMPAALGLSVPMAISFRAFGQ